MGRSFHFPFQYNHNQFCKMKLRNLYAIYVYAGRIVMFYLILLVGFAFQLPAILKSIPLAYTNSVIEIFLSLVIFPALLFFGVWILYGLANYLADQDTFAAEIRRLFEIDVHASMAFMMSRHSQCRIRIGSREWYRSRSGLPKLDQREVRVFRISPSLYLVRELFSEPNRQPYFSIFCTPGYQESAKLFGDRILLQYFKHHAWRYGFEVIVMDQRTMTTAAEMVALAKSAE